MIFWALSNSQNLQILSMILSLIQPNQLPDIITAHISTQNQDLLSLKRFSLNLQSLNRVSQPFFLLKLFLTTTASIGLLSRISQLLTLNTFFISWPLSDLCPAVWFSPGSSLLYRSLLPSFISSLSPLVLLSILPAKTTQFFCPKF